MSNPRKLAWQRKNRQQFVADNGFSSAAHYATGGLRKAVLWRDGYACVNCGMTDDEHKRKWGRPITIDHRDKDRSHNTMDNLQTMCLECHGSKDLIPELRKAVGPEFKKEIIDLRAAGWTYRQIAGFTGISVGTVYRWEQIWNAGRDPKCQNHLR